MSIFKFFDKVFASTGDVTAVPDGTQSDGSVSFEQGYGPDYSLDPGDPAVLYPERNKMNWLFKAITAAIQEWQVHAFPDFINASDNGGSAYSYDKNAYVRWTDKNVYVSLVDTNTATPTDATKWGLFNPFPPAFVTGDMMLWESTTIRTGGWVWANGQTVGDASSNATGRANVDCLALFTQIWTSFPNSERPILNSDGSVGIRGVSAAADWAAHKAIPLRDMRDVVPAGTATMGGTSNRGLLTGYRQGVDGSVFGATGGEEKHVPTTAETASHNHSVPLLGVDGNWSAVNTYPNNLPVAVRNVILSTATTNTGGGQAFNVVQPTTICNFIIKL